MLVTDRYLVVSGGYCLLLVTTTRYRLLLVATTFSMNDLYLLFE